MKICVECGGAIQPDERGRKGYLYCSDECRPYVRSSPRMCRRPDCNNPVAIRVRNGLTLYCSADCQWEWKRQKDTARRERRRQERIDAGPAQPRGLPVERCPRCECLDLVVEDDGWGICQTCGYRTDRPNAPVGRLTPDNPTIIGVAGLRRGIAQRLGEAVFADV